jgi:hypothetical protein
MRPPHPSISKVTRAKWTGGSGGATCFAIVQTPFPQKKKKASFLSSKIIGTSIKLVFIFYFFGGTGAGTQVLGRFSTA